MLPWAALSPILNWIKHPCENAESQDLPSWPKISMLFKKPTRLSGSLLVTNRQEQVQSCVANKSSRTRARRQAQLLASEVPQEWPAGQRLRTHSPTLDARFCPEPTRPEPISRAHRLQRAACPGGPVDAARDRPVKASLSRRVRRGDLNTRPPRASRQSKFQQRNPEGHSAGFQQPSFDLQVPTTRDPVPILDRRWKTVWVASYVYLEWRRPFFWLYLDCVPQIHGWGPELFPGSERLVDYLLSTQPLPHSLHRCLITYWITVVTERAQPINKYVMTSILQKLKG